MASVSDKRVTGVAYDSCLEAHYSLWNKDYTEHPERTRLCIERCEKLGLLSRCKRFPVREATLEEIKACHTNHHYDLLSSTQWMNEEQLQQVSQEYDYSYFHPKSFDNARLALGATIDLVEEVVTEKISNGMALVRPPGHHAMREEFSGYCYLNNVAVAAQLMMNNHGLERIIILDWDVHHGQGSQFLFYDDPRVLYVSIHRYEYGNEWPYLRESDYDFIGEGAGKGFNINLPLNEIGCGNDDFLSMFFYILLPIFHEFNPQLVLVSAGYDSAIGCPEGEMKVTPACFAHFVNLLTPLARGKLALILEGGYNLKSLPESAALSLRALLGDVTPFITPISTPKLSVIESVLNAGKCLHPYWKSLCYHDIVDRSSISTKSYPYPYVLQNPPKEGVDFYTRDSRPKLFPLLQDCISDNALDAMDEINKRIDFLIRTTCLEVPHYKLNVSHAGCEATGHLYSHLCQNLKAKQLWKDCLDVHISEGTDDESVQSYVNWSIGTIIDGKSQASLIITNHHTESENFEDHIVPLSVKYARTNYGVQRMMVLQILDSNNTVPASTDIKNGILSVNLALPGFQRNKAKQPTEKVDTNGRGTESKCVTIPFMENPVTDADILTAFQQIVLPISYEFCPDLIIFAWNSTTTVSIPVMETITQYLHGLGQGKLLVFVNKPFSSSPSLLLGNGDISHESTDSDATCEENEVKLITQCASVLLGDRCSPHPTSSLSNRMVGVIKEILDDIKHQWKSLVYRVQVPKQGS